ncbi:IclR family transcriptional regulator [Rathayibacter sp. KR2-224]|uniref:IclR family transcriptional regulator n=1 Tax=Rathayibacter sp. KR2-224 TaxID=3400913 RepID=UPI003C01BA43
MSASGAEERLVGADRVLAVLIELAQEPGGVTLDDMANRLGGSKPTIHRALATLRRAGLATQVQRGTYVLGDEFFRLAFLNYAARPDGPLMMPVLEALVDRFGETAHYGVLDGRDIVYRAKLDPPQGAFRLTSVIGGRNPAQFTAVGKLLLSYAVSSERELEEWVGSESIPSRTPNSIVSTPALWQELQRTRERDYAIDDQENEVGVNCVAVPVRLDPGLPPVGAVSISAIAFRLPLTSLVDHVDEIRRIVDGRGAATPVGERLPAS